jgi:hypothetical protein
MVNKISLLVFHKSDLRFCADDSTEGGDVETKQTTAQDGDGCDCIDVTSLIHGGSFVNQKSNINRTRDQSPPYTKDSETFLPLLNIDIKTKLTVIGSRSAMHSI